MVHLQRLDSNTRPRRSRLACGATPRLDVGPPLPPARSRVTPPIVEVPGIPPAARRHAPRSAVSRPVARGGLGQRAVAASRFLPPCGTGTRPWTRLRPSPLGHAATSMVRPGRSGRAPRIPGTCRERRLHADRQGPRTRRRRAQPRHRAQAFRDEADSGGSHHAHLPRRGDAVLRDASRARRRALRARRNPHRSRPPGPLRERPASITTRSSTSISSIAG